MIVGGLGGSHGMRMEGTGNLFGYEGRAITSGEEGMDKMVV